MSRELTIPADGIPEVCDTPETISAVAAALADGVGPVAVDTERAAGFRYDDRAFLIQLRRRGAGTFLIAPEGHRAETTAALAPVLSDLDWILHAAPSDLPCLADLGLYPATLFDTQLAGRMAGIERTNLAAMLETIFDVSLAKGHGAEDWSTTPLPREWKAYAALDVEMLIELAEVMAELLDGQGKLDWAEQEFAYLAASASPSPEPTWRDLKGIGTLKTPEQLQVAKHLWTVRDRDARSLDISPTSILPHRVLVEIARQLPESRAEMARLRGVPRRDAGDWYREMTRARRTDQSTWPQRLERGEGAPSKIAWQQGHPESWALYQKIRAGLDTVADQAGVPTEVALKPSTLRDVVWEATEGGAIGSPDELRDYLARADVRPWQTTLAVPVILGVLFELD